MSADEKLNDKQFPQTKKPKSTPSMYDMLPERQHRIKIRLDQAVGGKRE
jgi:hypothetical protein